MTLLTPTFSEQHKGNGAAGPVHVIAAHEPTREGETPPSAPVGPMPGAAHNPTPGIGALPLKVALIGTAPSSRMLAPYGDPSWQIWGCSPGNMNTLPRVDLWFELHSNLLWPEHENYGRPYIEWLKAQPFPVYMQDQSLVPRATIFPKDEIVAEFGDDFFTSSFTWMMALAMKMGAVEIALYGIDMASRDEYVQQRPGFFFFRYLARQRGIKISAPHESDIMQSPALYAYVDSTPLGRKLSARRQEVQGRINGHAQQIEQATRAKTYLEGAVEDIDYMQSIWSGVSNDMGKLTYENNLLRQRIAQLQAPPPMPILPSAAVGHVMLSPTTMTTSLSPEIENFVATVRATPQRRRRKAPTIEQAQSYLENVVLPAVAPLENPDG
jgi:hypothetical protein